MERWAALVGVSVQNIAEHSRSSPASITDVPMDLCRAFKADGAIILFSLCSDIGFSMAEALGDPLVACRSYLPLAALPVYQLKRIWDNAHGVYSTAGAK